MGLISYREWLSGQKESSAATRSKLAAAQGLGPDVADVFGHATPPPWVAEKLLAKLEKGGKKPNRKKKDDPLKNLEEKVMAPNYSIDRLINKAEKASKDIEKEKEKAEKEGDRLDKEIQKKRRTKKTPPPQPEPPQNQEKPEPAEEPEETDEKKAPVVPKATNPYLSKQPAPPKANKRPARRKNEKLTEEQVWEKLLDTSLEHQS